MLVLVGVLCLFACSSLRPHPDASARGAAASKARAFVVEDSSQLLPGPAAVGRVGDLRLDNGRVAFIVSAIDHQTGVGIGGGHVLDAAPLPDGRDHLSQVVPRFGRFPRQALYDRMTVEERPGAVVARFGGRESHDPEVDVTTEYELRDGSPVLQIRTTLQSHHAEPVPERPLGDLIMWGTSRRWIPGFGWSDPEGEDFVVPFVTALGTDASYAYGPPRGWQGGKHAREWTMSVLLRAALPPGERVTYRRFLAVVPGTTVPAATAVARAHRHERVAGAFVELDADEEGRSPVSVRVDSADGKPVSFFRTDVGSSVLVPLRRGEYRARVVGPDRTSPEERVVVHDGDEEVELEPGPSGVVDCAVRDPSGAPVPARIVITGLGGTPDPDGGPWNLADGSGNVFHAPEGRIRAPAPPGRYRVRASRGPEWEIASVDVRVRPGAVAPAEIVLERSVDTSGYVAADLHQHVRNSADSGTAIRDRVIQNVCEGVELVVSTDHNYRTDFAPTIEEIGLGERIRSVVGNEISLDFSTWRAGHFNVFPLQVDPDAPRGGAIDGRDVPPAEIFARLLADGVERVVQVNHPRSSKNGFFALAELDAEAGTGNGLWDPGFDAVEVWNGARFDQVEAAMADIRAFWNRGIPYTATGSSDTHQLVGAEGGFPRTYLRVGTEDLSAIGEGDLVTVLRRTHDAIVTNGPFVLVEVEGESVGGLATLPEGRGHARVEVRAASWFRGGKLTLVLGGELLVDGEALPGREGEPLAHTYEIDLTVRRDSWLQVLVRADPPHPLLSDEQVPMFAFTNPIWLDVDGNGRYDPP